MKLNYKFKDTMKKFLNVGDFTKVNREERWLSGRKRTTRNRLIGNYSWVRIPPFP